MNFTVSNEKVLFGSSAISGIGESLLSQIIQMKGNKNGIYQVI